jgi:hypothetical protein
MLRDRHGNEVSTSSKSAMDDYVEGVDLFLAAQAGADTAFERAIVADESFALAHAALARSRQMKGRPADAAEAMTRARACSDGLPVREQGHLAVIGHLIDGNGPAAYAAVLDHVADFPRDALIVQPCCGVFGLIGFSGKAGREAEQLAFLSSLAPHLGGERWFDCQHAFAQAEAGQLDRARKTIERGFAANRSNANGAHIQAHVFYECGENAAGRALVENWRPDYARGGLLHCHISWHEALSALEAGDSERAWHIFDSDIRPGAAWGPPINVLTDSAAFLVRAEIAGETRRDDLWRDVSQYASTFFAKPGISFADAHAAIAHAMAGDDEALAKLCENPAGVAGDLVKTLTDVYAAFARFDWQTVIDSLPPVMATHERLGGSRAQRDLLEFTLVSALLKLGRGDEASRLLTMRRPNTADTQAIAGLRN